MREFYKRVSRHLDMIDFEAIYPEFHRYPFALYNETAIFLEDKEIPQQGFMGNSTINFEGKQIAIWNVDQPIDSYDLDVFTSGIVHEMFHAFQITQQGRTEYPNDLKLLQYPEEEANYLIKQNENELLASAMNESSARKAEIISILKASRDLRRATINEFVHQEELIEDLEGSAECAGLLALKQLSEDKYLQKIRDYSGILKAGTYLFDARRNSYFSGALLRLLEREASEIGSISQKIKDNHSEKEKQLTGFFSVKRSFIKADGFICGYDPMNQIRLGDRILTKHFVMLNIGDETLTFKGATVLEMKEGSHNLIKGYWR